MNAQNEEEREEDLDSKAVKSLIRVLTDDAYSNDARLSVLRGLKFIFNKGVCTLEQNIMNSITIESLFHIIKSSDKEKLVDNRIEYINILLHMIDYNRFSDEVKAELTLFLKELNSRELELNNEIIYNIWTILEKHGIITPELLNELMPYSRSFFEEKVLRWINLLTEDNYSNIHYYAEASIHSKCLFQMLTAMLNTFVRDTKGNNKILDLVEEYASSVNDGCHKSGKSILSLYPREYCRLISLMSIPPKLFLNEGQNDSNIKLTKGKILKIIFEHFNKDSEMVLLLLTHFPKWLELYADYLNTMSKESKC